MTDPKMQKRYDAAFAKRVAEQNARFHQHRAEACAVKHRDSEGLTAVMWMFLSEDHRESARYWRSIGESDG